VTGADGKLVFLVIKSMPDEYRTRIRNVVQGCYPNDFLPLELGKVALKARHFCFWNQYAESVCLFLLLALGRPLI